MASTIERNTTSPKSGSLNSFPTHVIWTKDERFAYRLRTPPAKESPSSTVNGNETESEGGGGRGAVATTTTNTVNPLQRIHRLERNVHFLQTQHKTMLRDLHVEIETLKMKNRDLQFQLIIGVPLIAEVDEEEEVVRTRLLQNSSTQTEDSAPLRDKFRRFSHMEGELSSLRLALEDAENRNSSLSNLVSQLKSSHLKLKSKSANNIVDPSKSGSVPRLQEVSVPLAYARKFEEYEGLVRRLKKENVEQKHELEHVRSCLDNYRTVTRNDSSKPRTWTERLPKIPQPLQTARPNQARKTTELPYIHPLQNVYQDDSAFKDKRYVSSRGHLQRVTYDDRSDKERRVSDASWTRQKPPQRRRRSDHDYADRNLESKTRETNGNDNW